MLKVISPKTALKNFVQKYGLVFELLYTQKWIILFLLIIEAVFAVLSGIIPYFSKLQLDQLAHGQEALYKLPTSAFFIFFIALLVPAMLDLLSVGIHNELSGELSSRLQEKLKNLTLKRLWQKLYDFDAGFFSSERNRFLFSQAVDSCRLIGDYYNFIRNNFGLFITLFTILPILAFVSWQLLLLVSIASLLQFYLSKQSYALRTSQDLETNLLFRQRESISSALNYNFFDLKTIGIVKKFIDKQEVLVEKEAQLRAKQSFSKSKLNLIRALLENSLIVLANLWVGYEVLQGRLSLGTFSLTVSYSLSLQRVFSRFSYTWEDWQRMDLDYFRLQFLFTLKSRLQSVTKPLRVKNPGKIELKNVSFSYPDYYEDEREYFVQLKRKLQKQISTTRGHSYYVDVLKELERLFTKKEKPTEVIVEVSLELRRGQILALLGRNGAGKSTTTRLLLHNYEPDKGQVLLDGQEIFRYESQDLFKQFAILPQQPLLLMRLSLWDNLALGVSETVTKGEVEAVLRDVDLWSVVEGLPKGLDSILGEDTRFSGGQEQLIALARVLLQKRPFIILDEGSSQLDVEKESKIFAILKRLAKEENTGVLFITHRITTARHADKIVILDGGRIVEQGTHSELLAADGLYKHFWNLQVAE